MKFILVLLLLVSCGDNIKPKPDAGVDAPTDSQASD